MDATAPQALVSHRDLVRAAELLNLGLGSVEDRLGRVRARAADPRGLVLGVRPAAGEPLAGVATATVRDMEGIRARLEGDEDLVERVRALAGAGPVGVMEQVVVSDGCRGRGIGTRLTRARFAWMRDQGARAVISLVWASGEGRPALSARTLEGLGLRPLDTRPDFWRVPGAPPDYCPRCGVDCRCAAILYGVAVARPSY